MTNTPNLAIFCDFENVAIGAHEAKYPEFNIDIVLERLLDKGNIVVKKAYSDWDRYKKARKGLHESGFELIEVPHVSYSGKNSADIRLVVDALDLCYTKSHLDVFVVVSGDSDFSPLVSKLRENNKMVIGLGVKNSSSDLLIENCDEFIYYDDLVKRKQKRPPRATSATNGKGGGRSKKEALDLIMNIVDALFRDRDDNLWGSMIKQTLKRKRPEFSEGAYGYRSFNQLLEDAAQKGLLEIQKDERSGGYIVVDFGPKA